jgi:uracil-DNA glycosylase
MLLLARSAALKGADGGVCIGRATHVELARPKRLLLLGEAPSRTLLGKPLIEARGHVHKIESVRTIATFHPRHLLQRSDHKALAWKDLLLLIEEPS